MIRRSPAESFIKYLLLLPEKYSNKRVLEICQEHQIDALGNWYLNKLRQRLAPPLPFRPRDLDHGPSQSYLMLEALHRLFHPDEAGVQAFRMLDRPRVKEFIEAMTLVGAPHHAIAHGLIKTQNFPCKARDVQRFCHFFWDLSLLDSTETRALIDLRKSVSEQSEDDEIRGQSRSVKHAAWNDPRRIASDLPASPVTALLSQMRMGLMPSKLDLARVLNLSMQVMSMRILEAAITNGPKDSMKAADYANAMRQTRETLEGIVKPDEELQKQLRAISLRTDTYAPPLLQALSAGRHTAELTPLGDTTDGTDNYGDDGPSEAASYGE